MKITIDPFNPASIAAAVKVMEQYERDFQTKVEEFVRRLAEIGVRVASAGFETADYDGTRDVTVTMEQTGGRVAVIASGETVGFIEFGTGVRHPEWSDGRNVSGAPYTPPAHGTYGKGKGANPKGWYFSPSPGASQHTYGNTPAYAMLTARDEMVENVTRIAREVWK